MEGRHCLGWRYCRETGHPPKQELDGFGLHPLLSSRASGTIAGMQCTCNENDSDNSCPTPTHSSSSGLNCWATSSATELAGSVRGWLKIVGCRKMRLIPRVENEYLFFDQPVCLSTLRPFFVFMAAATGHLSCPTPSPLLLAVAQKTPHWHSKDKADGCWYWPPGIRLQVVSFLGWRALFWRTTA